MTEQMVGGSADTLQLCTLPLELLPTLYTLLSLALLSVTLLSLLSHIPLCSSHSYSCICVSIQKTI